MTPPARSLFAAAALLVAGCGAAAPVPATSATPDHLAPGQRWSYRTRPGDEASRLTVLKVETLGDTRIAHVAIDGVAAPCKPTPLDIGHLPFSHDALRSSLATLAAVDTPLPSFQSGYDVWRAAYDANQGGIFTAPVAEVVDALVAATCSARSEAE